MKIIVEKRFKISSVIENLSDAGLAVGDTEKTEITPDCFVTDEDGVLLITYSEKTDGAEVFSDITVTEKTVRVKRRGAIESDMLFEEGRAQASLYKIPPYSFDMEIITTKIRNNLTRDGGCVQIFYKMKIGGQDQAVRMKIECL